MKIVLSSRFRLGAFLCSGAVVALGAFFLIAPHAEAVDTVAASASPQVQTQAPPPETNVSVPAGPAKKAIPATLDKRIVVTKIHEVRNDETNRPRHNDALEFEKEYWNYGAITKEQLEARRGQIYVISWKNDGPPDRFIAKFEYRQEKTREQIKVQTQEYPAVSGNARAIFKVIGSEYRNDGPVESWRFTVLREGRIVAQERSFIW